MTMRRSAQKPLLLAAGRDGLSDMIKTRTSRPQQTSNQDHGGLIPPHEMFGRPLPRPFFVDGHLPFEERVERALRHIETTRFTEDEHERMREALVEMVTAGNL